MDALRDWLARDLARGDAAIGKHELLAWLRVNEYSYGPTRQHDQALMAEAEELIAAGEALAATLPPPTAAQRQGGLARLCGQLAQVRGDAEAVVAAWAAALEHYDRAGPALYAANCPYMLARWR